MAVSYTHLVKEEYKKSKKITIEEEKERVESAEYPEYLILFSFKTFSTEDTSLRCV